jgi:hypothetical protein
MKVRFKQGGAYKYFYAPTIAATLLTVTAGTANTVANATITDVYYSFIENPYGWPGTFACAAPTWDTATIDNGTGGQQPTAGSSSFRIIGDWVEWNVSLGATNVNKTGAGTSIAITALSPTLPAVASAAVSVIGVAFFTYNNYPGTVIFNSGSSITAYNATSIADNQTLVYSSISVKYRY